MVSKLKTGNNQYYRVSINRKGHKVDKLFYDMKSAKAFEDITRTAIDNGTYLDEDSRLVLIPNVQELLEKYFDFVKEHNKEAVAYQYTIKNKEYKLKKQLPFIEISFNASSEEVDFNNYKTKNKQYSTDDKIPLGEFYADCVDSFIIQQYVKTRTEMGLKQGSIHTELMFLKQAFRLANRLYPHLKSEDVFIKNPFDELTKTDLPKRSPPRKKVVSEEHIKKVFAYFESKANKEYLLAFKIALETGLRLNETLAILNKNINHSKSTIYIPKTKNGSDRTVLVSSEVLEDTKQYKDREKLFSITQYSLHQMWYRCFDDTPKEQRPTWHSLKNTAISRYINQNKNSTIAIADRFRTSTKEVNAINELEGFENFRLKIINGIKPTDEEIQKYLGGHKTDTMTQRYFVGEN